MHCAICGERLSLAEDGRVVYALRCHWKDGTRAVVFHPLEAPAAEWRDWIVPVQPRSMPGDPSQSLAAKALRPRARSTSAEL